MTPQPDPSRTARPATTSFESDDSATAIERPATAAYSIRMKVRLDNHPGSLGRLTTAIGAVGGNISAIGGFDVRGPALEEDLVINCRSEKHIEQVRAAVDNLDGIEVLEILDRTYLLHDGGKIEVLARMPVGDSDDLSMAYTPGVARVCSAIAKDPRRVHDLTIKKNTVAIVTDGTAVLGLGDIGPEAAMPVMEGKALLFKHFAGVDGFPVCLDVAGDDGDDKTVVDHIVDSVCRIAPTFGGVNLEDIAAPECFEVEERLIEKLDIPVFHDDQHGTAVVTLAALENALKLVDKSMEQLSVVVAGVGAAGVAISKILMEAGVKQIVGVDRKGAIWEGRDDLNVAKLWFAENTNPERREGTLSEVLPGTDVFIGVSGPGLITAADLRRMAPDPIVFAMANPDPEIAPEEADGLARVIATGRSDYPNQINNVLAFPGIFRGALDVAATTITDNMKLAAAGAIAECAVDELAPDHIVPSVFDTRVAPTVAAAVAQAAVDDGVVRLHRPPQP